MDSYFCLADSTVSIIERRLSMKKKLYYDTIDCMKLIKEKYPFIPIWIIRRVLYAEELYMHKVGIIEWEPDLGCWEFKK